MSIVRKAGTADVSVVIRIIDSADGTPETGVTSATGGLDLEYRREGAAVVNLTESDLSALTDAHSDGGMLHISAGYYRVDLPDAAVTTGATGVLVSGTATGMVVIGEYIQLMAYDPFDTVRLGLTALPNAAADAAGGLIISDAGGLDADAQRADVAAILVDTAEIGAAGAGLTNINLPNQTMDIIGNITGNLSGSVGSVTGAVGSVTGAVGSVAAGGITAASIATDAIDADALAADAATEIANAVWDTDATGRQTQGTFGQAIGDPAADANTIFKAVVTDATGATIGVDVVTVMGQTDDIGVAGAGLTNINLPDQTMNITGDITGNLSGSVGSVTGAVGSIAAGGIATTSFAAGAIDAAAIAADAITSSELAQSAAQEVADEMLNRNIAGGGSGGARTVRDGIRSLRNRQAISAGTLTVYQEDDATPAWTAAVTTTAGNPLSEVDPA